MRKFSSIVVVIFVISIVVILILLNLRYGFLNKVADNNSNSNISSCGFLDEEFCDDGKIETVKFEGSNYDVVGFKLPEGTEIKAPFELELLTGTYDEESTFPLKGDFVILNKKEDLSESAILVGDMQTVGNEWIKPEGGVIAKISGNDTNNLDGYNLIIMFMNATGGNEIPNKQMLNRYF